MTFDINGVHCESIDEDIITIKYSNDIIFNKDIILYSFFINGEDIFFKIHKSSLK